MHAYMLRLEWRALVGQPWDPDILMETPNGHHVLIEFKPDWSTYNIITAVGQLICYACNHRLNNVKKVLATRIAMEEAGIRRHLLDALKENEI